MLTLRPGDPVRAVDCSRRGRVAAVYPTPRGTWYKVQFAAGSPFLDDWTLYHATELAPWAVLPPGDLDLKTHLRCQIPGLAAKRK